jgi:hypothetical protein
MAYMLCLPDETTSNKTLLLFIVLNINDLHIFAPYPSFPGLFTPNPTDN